MLSAVEETARLTIRTTREIVALMEAAVDQARQRVPRTTYSRELIELVFVQPYVKIEHVVASGIAERRTASKSLKQLEEIGILKSHRAWKETIFINHRLMDLIRDSDYLPRVWADSHRFTRDS